MAHGRLLSYLTGGTAGYHETLSHSTPPGSDEDATIISGRGTTPTEDDRTIVAAPGPPLDDLTSTAPGAGGGEDRTVVAGAAVTPEPQTEDHPRLIGRYRINRLIARGGQGAVYEAEQDNPSRLVALKVIATALASADLIRRFEQEAQALGRLQHPGIAQIYEAGTAFTGFTAQPYFAMEFIRGENLRDYAAAHELDIRQRLELVIKVCDAVQHAHQRGIIHRDLKPANIIVDASGQPKILDFGVARLGAGEEEVDRGFAAQTTGQGQIVGTLAYMSPEQLLDDPLETDTRADVYALGVILFELLAGRQPFKLSSRLDEALAVIRDAEAPRLGAIDRRLRGDLELIVAQALRKDKTLRYGAASALAADLRRFLADEPISARRPSTLYVAAKFAVRHRILAGAALAVLIVLVSEVVASTYEAVRADQARRAATRERDLALKAEARADRERDAANRAEIQAEVAAIKAETERRRADREAETTRSVNDFLTNDLLAQASANTQAGSHQTPDPDLKVRTALDRAAEKLTGKFKDNPALEASIRQTIGAAYNDLGLYPQAQAQLERAVALRAAALGAEHADTLNSASDLASAQWFQGRYADAEAGYKRVLAGRIRTQGVQSRATLASRFDLASTLIAEGRLKEAESLTRETLALQKKVLGPSDPDTLKTENNLSALYYQEHKLTEAVREQETVVRMERQAFGESHPETLRATTNLAALYWSQGAVENSARVLEVVLPLSRRALGETHPDTLTATNLLSNIYRSQGRYEQSSALAEAVYEARRRLLGDQHPETLSSLELLARNDESRGRFHAAAERAALAVEGRLKAQGERHVASLRAEGDLGRYLVEDGRATEAEPLLAKAASGLEKAEPDNWTRFAAAGYLGVARLDRGDNGPEVEALLRDAYAGLTHASTANAQLAAHAQSAFDKALRTLYRARGDSGKLKAWTAAHG
jgi:eukaryotic-like serine/threonine-protein kinase